MEKTSRLAVFAALNEERTYQEQRWAGHQHSPEEYLIYIEHYTNEAKRLAATLDFTHQENRDQCLAAIRKITALGVACLEEHGAPRRSM